MLGFKLFEAVVLSGGSAGVLDRPLLPARSSWLRLDWVSCHALRQEQRERRPSAWASVCGRPRDDAGRDRLPGGGGRVERPEETVVDASACLEALCLGGVVERDRQRHHRVLGAICIGELVAAQLGFELRQ